MFVLGFSFLGAFIGMSSWGWGAVFPILALLITGQPLHIAVGTNRIASLGKFFTSIPLLFKTGLIRPKLVCVLILVSSLWSFVGAFLAVHISKESFRYLIIVLLFAALVLYICRPAFWTQSSKSRKVGLLYYFLGDVYAGIFTAGAWIIRNMWLVYWKWLTLLEAMANNRIPSFVAAIVSASVFWRAWYFDLVYMVAVFLWTAVGGYLGTKLAITRGSGFIRYMGILALLITLVYVIFVT